ncbi:hypothetical protein M3194_20370 [Paenibacillus glycanilyticus]|nr:hypothetical protein [Paenibacillus glycanilyticus]MCM3629699.1 hypothetical protein [Paenibacillus glycanilyticus]
MMGCASARQNGALPRYVERLQQTGRGDAVPELIRRHNREMKEQRKP